MKIIVNINSDIWLGKVKNAIYDALQDEGVDIDDIEIIVEK